MWTRHRRGSIRRPRRQPSTRWTGLPPTFIDFPPRDLVPHQFAEAERICQGRNRPPRLAGIDETSTPSSCRTRHPRMRRPIGAASSPIDNEAVPPANHPRASRRPASSDPPRFTMSTRRLARSPERPSGTATPRHALRDPADEARPNNRCHTSSPRGDQRPTPKPTSSSRRSELVPHEQIVFTIGCDNEVCLAHSVRRGPVGQMPMRWASNSRW